MRGEFVVNLVSAAQARRMNAVSYTHLDVYKRQGGTSPERCAARLDAPVRLHLLALWPGQAPVLLRAEYDGPGEVQKAYETLSDADRGWLRQDATLMRNVLPVSYTHLDVYKRQVTTFVAYRYDLLQSLHAWTTGDFSGVLRGRYELLWIGFEMCIRDSRAGGGR